MEDKIIPMSFVMTVRPVLPVLIVNLNDFKNIFATFVQ